MLRPGFSGSVVVRAVRLLGLAVLCALLLSEPGLARPIQAPNSRVSLDLPDGFVAARKFSGFQHDGIGVSYIVQEMPAAAFDELVKGFTAEKLATRGVRAVEVGRLARPDEHLFLRGLQGSAAGDYAKFFVVFRSSDLTVLVSANVPQPALDARIVSAAEVEAVLASASVGSAVNVRELFRLAHLGPFQSAGTYLGTARLYTLDGRMEPVVKGVARSAFIVAPSLDQSPVSEVPAFAARLLQTLAGFRNVKPGPSVAIKVAGLDGVASEAEAEHAADGSVMQLYQVVLAPSAGGYYRLIGMARADEAERLMPEFRKMVDSFVPLDQN